ncbi:DNA polymerase [Bifidobacterium phage BD811P1]|nr:DNA polymerase [Bifidobacterium phage BD811P1]
MTMQDSSVGLWCSDGVIRFTDGTEPYAVGTPSDMMAAIMTGGKLTVYVVDHSVLNPFIAHVVHALPHNEHRANLSWDGIVSRKGKFFSFCVTIDRENSIRFFDISNLLRENCRITMTDGQLLSILSAYEKRGLCRITAGGASMEAFAAGDFKWYGGKFPQLEPEDKRLLHEAYIGGFMSAKEGRYGRAIDIDCNSMYPSILRDEWLPWGLPEPYDGEYERDDDMPLHCDELVFRADLKPDGYPFLLDNRSVYGMNRLTSTRGYVRRVLSDIDQKLLEENYNVTVYERVRGWKFRRNKGFFRSFVDEWSGLKQRETGEIRQMAKLVMNALVGKMASLPKDVVMLPSSKDGVTVEWDIAHRDGSNLKTDYLPIPIWVNAYARKKLMAVCRANADRLLYANTDGCMLAGWQTPACCDIHPTELGKWKVAAKYERLTILGMNRYQGWRDDGEVDVCMSGSLFSHPIPYERFRHGVQVRDDCGMMVML